jgi:hypothetical protein
MSPLYSYQIHTWELNITALRALAFTICGSQHKDKYASRFLHPQDICNCPEDGIPGTGHTLWETWRVSLTMSMTSPHTSKTLQPLSPSTLPRIRTAIHPHHPAKRQKLLMGTLHVQRRMEFSPFRDQILMVLSIPQLAILRMSDG